MKKNYFILVILLLLSISSSEASVKKNIIQNLKKIDNLSFNFEQNINGKIETGNCILKYPKKIYCKYNLGNQKILVSNGKSIVIKTKSSYYLYPIEKTPLNLILNKTSLLDKIRKLDSRTIDGKFINYIFFENENKVSIFFDINNYELIGWQTTDIYQNLIITYLSSIKKNQKVENNIFKLPRQN